MLRTPPGSRQRVLTKTSENFQMPRRRKIDRLPSMRTTALLLAAAALGGCSSSRAPSDKNQFTIQRIASPAAAGGSSEPQLTVTGDRAILSWVETTGASATLKFAERTGGGWSPPHQFPTKSACACPIASHPASAGDTTSPLASRKGWGAQALWGYTLTRQEARNSCPACNVWTLYGGWL